MFMIPVTPETSLSIICNRSNKPDPRRSCSLPTSEVNFRMPPLICMINSPSAEFVLFHFAHIASNLWNSLLHGKKIKSKNRKDFPLIVR